METLRKALADAQEQQTATGAILRVISSSPTDYQPVFDMIVRNAGIVCGAADAMLWTIDGDELVVRAHQGPLPATIGTRQPIHGSVAGCAVREGRVVHVDAAVKRWSPEQPQWVFLRENGEPPRYPAFLEYFWQKLLKRAGLRYRKFHSTRHTFITWAAEGCEALGVPPVPILTVRDWAGHSSVQETERYFHRASRRTHAHRVAGLDRYVQTTDERANEAE